MATPLIGTPSQEGPPVRSAQEIIQHFATLLSYALYEKTQPTEIDRALSVLILERHANFHAERYGPDWLKCGNDTCVEVKRLLSRVRLPRITMSALARELMDKFNLRIEPIPGGTLSVILEPAQQIVVPTQQPNLSVDKPVGSLIIAEG